jgi:hypothetical protein
MVNDGVAPPRASSMGRNVVFALSLLAVLCLFYGAWPVWRAFFPIEIDIKEPWNAFHVDAVLGKGALYPPISTLVANNYPPLSYYLIALLSSWSGLDAIYVGRALSFLSVVSIAVTVTLIIRTFNASWTAAILGGLWFFGSLVRFVDWYVAMNDPHLLALAISTAGLLWFLRRDPTRGAELPILLMVVAGFFKQVIVATPAAALLLLLSRNWRLALRAALVGAGAAILGIIACAAVYGMPFIEQLFLYPRQYSLLRALNSLERMGSLYPALLLAAIWAWHDRKSEAARFSTIYTSLAFTVYLSQKFGEVTDQNAQFELNVACAIGLGLAFDRLAVIPLTARFDINRIRLSILAILSACLLAGPGLEPYYLVASSDYRAQFWKNAEVTRDEIRRIAAIPTQNVTCNVPTVCRAAGKPFTYDVTLVGQKYYESCSSFRQLEARLETEELRTEKIDDRAWLLPLYRQLPHGRMPKPLKPGVVLKGAAPCDEGG